MKTLKNLALAAVMLTAAVSAQAEWVNGYSRSNGTYVSGHYRSDSGSFGGYSSSTQDYVYRNPYAADPSVNVSGYYRSSGTYVAPHLRTAPNDTVTDNLSYRGYPSQQPGYVSPRSYGLDSSWSRPTPLPSYGSYNFETPRPYTGGYAPNPLLGNSLSAGYDY